MGTACYGQGSYKEAARWFFEAADLSPSDPTSLLFLGKVEVLEITESAGYRERMARFARLQPDNASGELLLRSQPVESRRGERRSC